MNKILPYSPIVWQMMPENPEAFDTEKMKLDKFLPSLITGASINSVCFGGFLESYLSLCVFERIQDKYFNFFWIGNDLYYPLVEWQGLANIKQFDKDFLEDYPCPIISDVDNNIYVNCLFNTHDYTQNMWGNYDKPKRTGSYIRRILRNFLIQPNLDIYPKWRNGKDLSEKFKLWLSLHKDILNKKIILLLPDHMKDYSNHNFINFNWDINKIKAFIALAKSFNFEVIILSDQVKKYYGNIKFYEFSLESFFFFLEKAVGVISADIDISTITALHSDAFLLLRKPIGRKFHKYHLFEIPVVNKKKHFTYQEITIENAYKFIKRIDKWQNHAP